MQIEKEVREILTKHVKSNVDFSQIGATEPLEDSGMNSIDFIKVMADIEIKFNITFPNDDMDFDQYQTINELVNYIKTQINYSPNLGMIELNNI